MNVRTRCPSLTILLECMALKDFALPTAITSGSSAVHVAGCGDRSRRSDKEFLHQAGSRMPRKATSARTLAPSASSA
jgi:hypothetical protein